MSLPRIFLCALAAAAPVWAESPAFVVDRKHSRVDIAVDSTIDAFVGSLDAYKLSLSGDPATGTVQSAKLEFSFLDVHTGNKDRDAAMNTWEDSAHQPDGSFVLTSIAEGEGGKRTAEGKLTLHGHEVPIAFPVRVGFDKGRCTVEGDAPVDTLQFGLPIIRKMHFLKVDPVVHVRFHIEANAPEAG